MKIIEPGHIYELQELDTYRGRERQLLTFVNREKGHEHPGTQAQEVLRSLIDRTMHCDNCLPTLLDSEIVYHLRMALVLHEARALLRKTEKRYIEPENIAIGKDGHFLLHEYQAGPSEDSRNWVGRKR